MSFAPAKVVRYRCRELLGLPEMVISKSEVSLAEVFPVLQARSIL